jgi:hypothetical protein
MKKLMSTILKAFLGIFVFGLFAVNIFPYFIANCSDSGFQSPGSADIRTGIMEAAGSFLESHANFLLLLQKIELSELNGTDYTELQQLIDNAVFHMDNASAKYSALSFSAYRTPYNPVMISELKNFNYLSFRASTGLDSVIAEDAESYLMRGDIRGVYLELTADSQQILDRLIAIKSSLLGETFPAVPDLWQINRDFYQTLFFGQYTAQVFFEIAGKSAKNGLK